jgi:hypothetical protein
LGDIDNIIPDIEVSPFEILKQGGTPRRRASRSNGYKEAGKSRYWINKNNLKLN